MTRLAVSIAVAAACAGLYSPRLAQAQRALGVDVSHWQGSINWASVQNAGYSFAFIKGTEDDYYVDDYFASNVTKLSNTSMLFGAYHFAKPSGTTTAEIVADARAEANFFINNARNAMQPGNIIPTLDLESGSGLSNAQLTSWVLAFSDQVVARLGVKPMVYLNSTYSNQVNSGVSSLPLWWARVPTATTGYSTNTALTGNPTTDYGAWGTDTSVWKFWQYSWVGSVPGINGNVDLDVAHGDIEYVKDLAIPAMWTDATGGNFGGVGKWNNLDGAAGTLYFPTPTREPSSAWQMPRQ